MPLVRHWNCLQKRPGKGETVGKDLAKDPEKVVKDLEKAVKDLEKVARGLEKVARGLGKGYRFRFCWLTPLLRSRQLRASA